MRLCAVCFILFFLHFFFFYFTSLFPLAFIFSVVREWAPCLVLHFTIEQTCNKNVVKYIIIDNFVAPVHQCATFILVN